jgi:elongation factor G
MSVNHDASVTVLPANIRNVLLAGHAGSGKTTLIERMLFHTKTIAKMGSIVDGTTVCDHDAEAKAHKHSLTSSLAHFTHAGKRFNVIDSPGSGDFLGHAIGAFAPVETVLIVLDAAKGIEVNARRIARLATEIKLPRMIVINKIDHEEAHLEELLELVRNAFGPECLAVNLPVKGHADVIDVFDHLHADSKHQPAFGSVEDAHRRIVEQVVEMDEALTGEYFEKGDAIDLEKVRRAFEVAMRSGHLVPVCFVSAKTGAGVDDLLHIIADDGPTPQHETPPALMQIAGGQYTIFDPPIDPAAPAVAHVFKIINDPFVGKLAMLRVIQGTVRSKADLYHNEDKKPLRISHLFKVCGKEHAEVHELVAGDIGGVAKLDELKFGSILHADPALHLLPPQLPLPKPLFGLAVELKNHADETKFAAAVHKLTEEDPCFAMERVAATKQTVLRGLGELHLRVILERLKSRGIELTTSPTKVAYKETITLKADGHHRHKKQTGGAGQFGEVYLRVIPLPPDHPDGFEFENATVGGSIPRQFMPAIEKGVRLVLDSGAIAGYPLSGVRVEVYDGKYHDVDSKEVAFVAAGKKAFIDAIQKARPALLEPWVVVETTAPQRYMGDITADISGKRGRVQASDIIDGDLCVVKAVVPLSELGTYASQLKSMTAGQGSYSIEYSHDERTPPALQAQIIAAYKPHGDED